MAKYVYPAIFTKETDGGYSVSFPDIEGCYTCGDDLADSMIIAEDALALVLYGYEADGKTIPSPSDESTLRPADNEFVNYIVCDTLEYRRRYNNRSVKKTLTIPEWLNEAANDANLNFSKVLQDALKKEMHLN